MKKLVVGMLYAFCALTAVHSGDINAQPTGGTSTTAPGVSGTTANLITSGANQTWTGLGGVGTKPTDCCTSLSGSQPLYDPGTNTIHFSYGQATVGQAIAINNALSNVGSGVAVNGYNWGYDIRNNNQGSGQAGVDTLTAYSYMTNTANQVILSNTQTINTKIDWQTFNGTVNASTPQQLSNLNKLGIQFSGKDANFWGGYYGPEVRNVHLSLNYGAAPVTTHTMGDDGWVNVPLQFGFPFYGKVFTNSFMFDNGVVGFFDPVAGGCNPANGFCGGQQWNSQPFSNNMGNQFSYMIAPLWADLAPNSNTKYLTQGDATFQKYTWENIGQYYDQSKLQTFDLTIKPSGFIGVNYTDVNLNQTNVSIGTIGNPALGEYNQVAFHPAGTVLTGVPNWSLNNTPDACSTNPLASPSCPGYTDAMCTANPLYATTCPGYQQAYFTQQCSSNPLYSTQCPGYAVAYLELQCSANPLYSTTCQGYQQASDECSTNPLSHSYCTNYQTASTQCSINPLYGNYCPGYTIADTECSADPLSHTYCTNYQTATTQCTANSLYASYCPGYTTAQTTCSTDPLSNSLCTGYAVATSECSLNQLSHSYCPSYQTAQTTCTTNPLSNTLCTGYQTASTSCTSNALYASYCSGYQTALDTCSTNPLSNTMCPTYQTATASCAANPLTASYCPGYQFAYDCQQDGLYSKQCPNYAEAYAKKYVLNVTPTTVTTTATTTENTTTVTTTVVAAATTTEAITTQLSSGISDTTVSSVVTTKATSTSTEASPAAAVKLTAPAGATTTTVTTAAASEKKTEETKKEEKKDEGTKSTASNTSTGSTDSKPSDGPKTARQELAERRREAAAKEAVAKGANLANEMGKAADMEAQKAVQNVVIQAMGFTPGFDTYNKAMMPDSRFYAPKTVYGGQVNVDNKNISRRLMGGSDRTHEEMVESQYNRGN